MYTFVLLGWLQPVPGDDTKARCRICGTIMQAHIRSIVGHSEGKKHKEVMSAGSSRTQTSISDSLRPVVQDPTKLAELKMAVYISEHSSTLSIDHLGELLPQLDKRSTVLQKFKMHRTKCSRLQRNVIAPCYAKNLRKDIGDQYYSLIIDESTNQANVSCLGMSVRYFSASKGKVVDTFYRLVPVPDCTANTLYKTVKECMKEDGLQIEKLIGIGSDGANAMIGRKHSLVTLLQKDNPNITVFRCLCHSLHLAASKASELLPAILTFIVQETHNWFSSSPKRAHSYKEIYNVLEGSTPSKIPGMAGTRWLARLEAMNGILDQWDPLQLHFEMAASTERSHTARVLNDAYKDPQNKLYMLYARKVLKEVVKVNKMFQAEIADITKLTEELLGMYRNLMQLVVEPRYLSKCTLESLPNFKYMDYLIPVCAVQFGYEFSITAAKCSLNDLQITYVKERCVKFVVDLLNEVQLRLPDNINTLLTMKQLHPSTATSQCKQQIEAIVSKYQFTFADMDQLESEWNSLGFEEWPKSCLSNIVSFWAEVYTKTNSVGEKSFPNLSSLALALLSLPFSNASVERVFSQMNVVHCKLRNRLHVRSVEAILQIRYGLKLESRTCVSFTPSDEMVRNFESKNLPGTNEDVPEEDALVALDF